VLPHISAGWDRITAIQRRRLVFPLGAGVLACVGPLWPRKGAAVGALKGGSRPPPRVQKKKPSVPWVSCSLGSLPQDLCHPLWDGRGLHFLLSGSFWASFLWAPGVADILFGQKREDRYNEEHQYRPQKLYKVLRQSWPRFQRDLEQFMVPAFMMKVGEWLNIGSRGRVNGRNNIPIFSRDEAKKTMRAYWMINTAMGRNSVLVGLLAGVQRLKGIGVVMVDATATTDLHDKVTLETYAALLAMVRSVAAFLTIPGLSCSVVYALSPWNLLPIL